MNYYERMSAKGMDKLTQQIRAEYTKCWTDIRPVVDEYFRSFKLRSDWLIEQLDAGNVPLRGMDPEDYFKKWLYNQVGRGERWEALQEQIRSRIIYADKHAAAYMNEAVPTAYALAHNWTAYTIELAAMEYGLADGAAAVNVAFNIVNERAVQRLISEGVEFLPRKVLDDGKVISWCNRKTQSQLLSGIMSGDGVEKLAERFQTIVGMSERSALLNARTAITNAQNAGRQQCAEEAEEMGLSVVKEWRCTLDDKTRETHQQLDGERVPIDEYFSNHLMYPGDANGDPREIYNCRCTYITIVEGLNEGSAPRRARDEDGGGIVLENVTYTGRNGTMSYQEWIKRRTL